MVSAQNIRLIAYFFSPKLLPWYILFRLGVYHCSTYMSNYANPMPINPETVRLEVQALKSDFNSRLKQIMFNAIVSTYYATFIPCVFVPNALSYETPWVFRHVSNWIENFDSLGIYVLTTYFIHLFKCQSNYRGPFEISMSNLLIIR